MKTFSAKNETVKRDWSRYTRPHRCAEGPVVVVYPDAVWYTYSSREDVDEIVDEHLKNGRIVDRLRI